MSVLFSFGPRKYWECGILIYKKQSLTDLPFVSDLQENAIQELQTLSTIKIFNIKNNQMVLIACYN